MSRKEELIKILNDENAPQSIINDLLNAKSWKAAEKQNFVNWVTSKINYLSSQPIQYAETKKSLHLAKTQYELYLIVVNE